MTKVIRSIKSAQENSKEIFSSTAPTNTEKTWRNESRNGEAYFHDGSDWVSVHLYSAPFNKRGNVRNRSYFRIGDVDCDHDRRGFIAECEIKIVKANLMKENDKSGDLKLVSGGIEIDTFAISSDLINTVDSIGNVKVPPATHLALRWFGQSIKDPTSNIYYRKVA